MPEQGDKNTVEAHVRKSLVDTPVMLEVGRSSTLSLINKLALFL